MKIHPYASRPSGKGPASDFTGSVRLEPVIQAEAPARLFAAMVTFEPGARTNWHTHPYGQTLYVTAGAGLVQKWGEPIQQISSGDTVWFEPGEKHWHGARPEHAMTHMAMQEARDGSPTDWLEPVTDAQYQGED